MKAARTPADLVIREDDPAAPHVAALLALHLAEVRGAMGSHAYALDAQGLAGPDVTFWTAWLGSKLAGFAALKSLDTASGEVKSMRAAPEFRGTGVGRALLIHVIAAAKTRGYRQLFLETGTTPMHVPAVALYRQHGFAFCAPFAGYQASPLNLFMVLNLPAASAPVE